MRGAPAAALPWLLPALLLLLPATACGLRTAGRAAAEALLADAAVAHKDVAAVSASGTGPSHPILINVGMVGTATRSLTHALRGLGLRAAHVGPCNVPYDLDNSSSNMSRFLESKDAFSDIPFNGAGFIQVAARYAAKHPEKVKLVATVREKLAWIGSMLRNPGNGGCFVRIAYGVECNHVTTPWELSAMYDRHIGLLLQHNVTLLPLGRWGPLCEALAGFPEEAREACRRQKLSAVDDGLPRVSNLQSPRDADAPRCADHGMGSGY